MIKSVKDMVKAAKAELTEYDSPVAAEMLGREDVTFIDIRDIRELARDGRIPGAYHCPRGMLEFWLSPDSPYTKDVFQTDNSFVFFCAGGARSALAAKTAQDMGLKKVSHITDGFGGWKKNGLPVETED